MSAAAAVSPPPVRPRRAIGLRSQDGPSETLDLTENAQPAILATSIAVLEELRERWAADGLAASVPAFIAGHSMGQYSALVAPVH
jgi:malonyl CoA-acyl carrier protein transacylase